MEERLERRYRKHIAAVDLATDSKLKGSLKVGVTRLGKEAEEALADGADTVRVSEVPELAVACRVSGKRKGTDKINFDVEIDRYCTIVL